MQNFVIKKEAPPPSMGIFRARVLEHASRQGDLWLARYPLTHPLFATNSSGPEYAGCGALWRAVQPLAMTAREAQAQFNAVWKAEVKAVKPKEQGQAVEALRLSLVAKLQASRNTADELLVAELPRVLLHERATLLAMAPGPSRDDHPQNGRTPKKGRSRGSSMLTFMQSRMK